MNRKTALAAVVLLALAAAPELIHGISAAPGLQFPASKPAPSARTFKPSCLSNELTDIRPDPAWVGASYEHDNCVAPVMPLPPDGATARRETVVAAMAAVKRYGAEADGFQRCIVNFMASRRAETARTGKRLPAWLPILENHRILASQKNKERGQALMRSSIEAFNALGSECADHG